MSSYIVQNRKGENLVFDKSYKNSPIELSLKNEILDKYRQYGSIAQGDQKYSSRKLSFNFDLIATNPLNFRYEMNKISSFFNLLDSPFYLINLSYNIRSEVRLNKLKPNFKEGLEELIALNSEIEFELLDGLFYTNTPLEAEINSVVHNSTFELPISAEAKEAYGQIEFTCVQDCNEFALLNTTTGENFQIKENGFVAGKKIIVDNDKGLCFFEGNQRPLIMTSGSFMTFRNGNNSFKFQTPTIGIVNIKIIYREGFDY
jgi:hypothetical protein